MSKIKPVKDCKNDGDILENYLSLVDDCYKATIGNYETDYFEYRLSPAKDQASPLKKIAGNPSQTTHHLFFFDTIEINITDNAYGPRDSFHFNEMPCHEKDLVLEYLKAAKEMIDSKRLEVFTWQTDDEGSKRSCALIRLKARPEMTYFLATSEAFHFGD